MNAYPFTIKWDNIDAPYKKIMLIFGFNLIQPQHPVCEIVVISVMVAFPLGQPAEGLNRQAKYGWLSGDEKIRTGEI